MNNIDLNLPFPAVEPSNIAVSKAKNLRQYSQSTKLFPKQISVFTEDSSCHKKTSLLSVQKTNIYLRCINQRTKQASNTGCLLTMCDLLSEKPLCYMSGAPQHISIASSAFYKVGKYQGALICVYHNDEHCVVNIMDTLPPNASELG